MRAILGAAQIKWGKISTILPKLNAASQSLNVIEPGGNTGIFQQKGQLMRGVKMFELAT